MWSRWLCQVRRRRVGALLLGSALGGAALVGLPPPASAAVPDGVSGPVIFDDGAWLIRTTPSSGVAQLRFQFGRAGDQPIVGDWDGNGTETVGVVRNVGGQRRWFLRNSNTGGAADISFTFTGSVATDRDAYPIAGNFDPIDDAYEIGLVFQDDPRFNLRLSWQIRTNITGSTGQVVFQYGLNTDRPVVGDWDGDGTDTPGVVRGTNQWLLHNRPFQGGLAELDFRYGVTNPRVTELPIVGDWNGDGTDTPGVLRNVPTTEVEGGLEQWLLKNESSSGSADATIIFGSDAFTVDVPITASPRLAIEVT